MSSAKKRREVSRRERAKARIESANAAIEWQHRLNEAAEAAMQIYVGEGVRRMAVSSRTATDAELIEASL